MNKYQKLRNSGKLFGTIKRAIKLREKRDLLKPKLVPDIKYRFLKSRILIPLGSYHSESVQQICQENSRKKNWTSKQAGFENRIQTNDLGNYSSRCRYTHYTYTPVIESYARILNGKLYYHLDGKLYIKKSPQGWNWSKDEQGVKLVKTSNPKIDYHPSASDLIRSDWNDFIRSEGIRLYKVRQNNQKAQNDLKRDWDKRIKDGIKQGVYVRFKDSLIAGNCESGTRNWMINNGLDNRRMISLKELSKLTLTDRVKLVILTAIKRHRESLRNGYSTL